MSIDREEGSICSDLRTEVRAVYVMTVFMPIRTIRESWVVARLYMGTSLMDRFTDMSKF